MFKSIVAILSLVCLLFTFTGCFRSKSVNFDLSQEKVNYNNIYYFAHSGFWIDQGTIYYSQSGLYNTNSHYVDEEGKHSITSTRDLSLSTHDINGELDGEIQAYGNAVYFWFWSSDGTVDFYRYDKTEKTSEKIFTTDKAVLDWAVYQNTLVYTTPVDNSMTFDTVSLWYCDLGVPESKEISHKVTAFGIAGKGVRYVEQNDAGKAVLYHFDFMREQENRLCTFDGVFGEGCFYNFTDDAVVFGRNKLHILQISDGTVSSFELPDQIKYVTCYDKYAFMCSESSLYRISLATGEAVLLQEDLGECNLLHAISDETAVIACYNDDSLLTTSVTVYAIKANGEMEEILNL